MRKHIIGKPTCIFCSDLHIRNNTPLCRNSEEFEESMFSKLKQLNQWAKKYFVPIIIVGDVGDKAKWQNILVKKVLSFWFNDNIRKIVVPGQHDLPEHRLNKWDHGGLGILNEVGCIEVVTDKEEQLEEWNGDLVSYSACPYGEEPLHIMKANNIPNILLIHKLIIDDKENRYLGKNVTTARNMLNKYNQYDLIVSGDNHKPFTMKKNGRLLINCGSMMRTRIDQKEHRPRVYLWSAETNSTRPLYFKIKDNVIIERRKTNEDEKMKVYIKRLSRKIDITLKYEDNLKKLIAKNNIKKEVQKKIWSYVNG